VLRYACDRSEYNCGYSPSPHGGSDSTRDHPCGTTAFYRSLSSEHRSACTSSLDHSSVPRSSRFMPGQLHSRRSRTSVVHPTAREVPNLPDQPHRVMLRSGRIASHGRLSRTAMQTCRAARRTRRHTVRRCGAGLPQSQPSRSSCRHANAAPHRRTTLRRCDLRAVRIAYPRHRLRRSARLGRRRPTR
jgi:hypothetical protein